MKQIELRGRQTGLSVLSKMAMAVLAVLAVVSVSISSSGTASAQSEPRTHIVEIRQFKFFPANLTVNRGDRVVFKNLDIAPHTATSQDWDSGNLNRNQTWTMTANTSGVIEYICAYHPAMKGRLTVR